MIPVSLAPPPSYAPSFSPLLVIPTLVALCCNTLDTNAKAALLFKRVQDSSQREVTLKIMLYPLFC